MDRNIDYDKARAERDFRMNPPNMAAGQGGMSDDTWGDLFSNTGNNTSTNDNSWMGGSSNDSIGGMNMDINSVLNNPSSFNQGALQQQPQQPQARRGIEEVLEDAVTKGGTLAIKGLGAFLKELGPSFANNTAREWTKLGLKMIRYGLFIGVAGLVGCFLQWFIKALDNSYTLVLAGLMSAGVGFVMWYFFYEEAHAMDVQEAEQVTEPQEESISSFDDFSLDGGEDDLSWEETEGDDSFFEDDDSWDMSGDDLSSAFSGVYEEDVNIDSKIEEIPAITPGTQTREFLFETFTKVLPMYNPDFSNMKVIPESSDTFYDFSESLRDAAYQVGTNEEKIPELTELRENLFLIQLVATRPSGLKEQEIADELANMYMKDDYGRVDEKKEGSYATVNSVVGSLIINIFKGGASAIISLGDIYAQKEISEFVKNPRVKMPFIWGVDELGSVKYCDAKSTNSIIVSGIPRGGKSWKVQSIIAQYAMFSSPKELQFYIYDIKGDTSDYVVMSGYLPHIREFKSKKSDIIASLKKLTTKVAEEREALLKSYGFINIKDFKEIHPEVEMPYIYVVIDEMMNLTGSFTKEESAEFQSLLAAFVSRFPNLGFRVILIPHRIVNEVISKKVYPLVTCKMSIMQSFEEIKNGLDITRKDFPYNLPNPGDMALKTVDINKGKVVFCHGEAITSKNSMNFEVFRYIGEVWRKLEPEYCAQLEKSNISRINKGNGTSLNPVDRTKGTESYDYAKSISEEQGVDFLDDLDDTTDEDFWDNII